MAFSRDDDDDSETFTNSDRELTRIGVEVRHVKGRVSKLEEIVEGLDKQIRALQNFRWWLVGAMFGSGALFALVSKILEKL